MKAPFIPADPLLTEIEVSCWIKRTVPSMQRDRWAGTGIPFIKVGRLVRYRQSDVQAYLDANLRTSTSDATG